MKKAMFFKKLDSNRVQCLLCPNMCVVLDGCVGGCRVRKNIDGVLYSLNYGRIVSTAIDPIEKKPLFHFFPGAGILSIASVGCNFHCRFCQNYDISQSDTVFGESMVPSDIVAAAQSKGVKMIAYTYTEPTIYYEFMLETAKLAHKKGMKNVLVTNGYINKEPFEKIIPYIDAANIDVKSLENSFYQKLCGVKSVKPVLDTVKRALEMKIHVELTNLLIPGWNTSEKQITALCRWISRLDKRIPLHFSRYFPAYKMSVEPTSLKVLKMATEIAKSFGIEYVYAGNVSGFDENTYCSSCGNVLVEREGYSTPKQNLVGGKCPECGYELYGAGFL